MPSGRPLQRSKKAEKLKELGLFRLSEAINLGISHQSILRLVEDRVVDKLGRDLYKHSEVIIDPREEDFAIACSKFGSSAVIGGLSALAYHCLTDIVPTQIWVFVPSNRRTENPIYRLIRTSKNTSVGIEKHRWFQITSLERTIVDSFRYASKVGIDVGLLAGRQAVREQRTSAEKILEMARSLGFEKYIIPNWGALTAE